MNSLAFIFAAAFVVVTSSREEVWKRLAHENGTIDQAAVGEMRAATRDVQMSSLRECSYAESDSQLDKSRKLLSAMTIVSIARETTMSTLELLAEANDNISGDDLTCTVVDWLASRGVTTDSKTDEIAPLLHEVTQLYSSDKRSEKVRVAYVGLCSTCCAGIGAKYVEFFARDKKDRTDDEEKVIISAVSEVQTWIAATAHIFESKDLLALQQRAVISLRSVRSLADRNAIDMTPVISGLTAVCNDTSRTLKQRLAAAFELDVLGVDMKATIKTLREQMEKETAAEDAKDR